MHSASALNSPGSQPVQSIADFCQYFVQRDSALVRTIVNDNLRLVVLHISFFHYYHQLPIVLGSERKVNCTSCRKSHSHFRQMYLCREEVLRLQQNGVSAPSSRTSIVHIFLEKLPWNIRCTEHEGVALLEQEVDSIMNIAGFNRELLHECLQRTTDRTFTVSEPAHGFLRQILHKKGIVIIPITGEERGSFVFHDVISSFHLFCVILHKHDGLSVSANERRICDQPKRVIIDQFFVC